MALEITAEHALERLRAKITYGVKIKDLAAEFGVSPPFMSAVLSGAKGMTEPMLDAVGVERRVSYYDKNEGCE